MGNKVFDLHDWRTVYSLNIFDKLDSNKKRVILRDFISVYPRNANFKYQVDLVVSKLPAKIESESVLDNGVEFVWMSSYNDGFTFSSLKQSVPKSKAYFVENGFDNLSPKILFKEIFNGVGKTKGKQTYTYILEEPIHMRAQDSTNRTGYGNEYNGQYLVKKGTLYGETYCYQIFQIIFTRI